MFDDPIPQLEDEADLVPTEEVVAAPETESIEPTKKNKGGRPRGSKNKRTLARAERLRELSEQLKAEDETLEIFNGDAHSLLCAIYRDPKWPIDIRMDAAKAAIKFEKPALASTEMTGKDGSPLHPPDTHILIEYVDPEPRGDDE